MTYLLQKAIAVGSIDQDALDFLTDRGATIYSIEQLFLIRLPDSAHMQKDPLGAWIIGFSNEQGYMEYGHIEVHDTFNVYQTKAMLRQYEKACPLCEAREAHSYVQHEQAVGLLEERGNDPFLFSLPSSR